MKKVIEGLDVRLRKLMEEKGWNYKVLSDRANIHYQEVHKLVRGNA